MVSLYKIPPGPKAVSYTHLDVYKRQALYNEIEFPLAQVLADMTRTGVLVDKDGIEQFGVKLREELEQDVYKRQDRMYVDALISLSVAPSKQDAFLELLQNSREVLQCYLSLIHISQPVLSAQAVENLKKARETLADNRQAARPAVTGKQGTRNVVLQPESWYARCV